jgi:hypothetical protein
MKFIHRLGYYLGGFALGLVLLMFFLNGKDASCDYSPNARATKNMASKAIEYSDDVAQQLLARAIDSTVVRQLIKFGDVDFSESDLETTPCKTYHIENSYKESSIILKIENCETTSKIISFIMK